MLPSLADPEQRRPLVLALLLALMLAEALWLRRLGRPGYDWRESAASTAIAVGNAVLRPLTALALLPVFGWVYEHRLFDWPLSGIGDFLLLFLAFDLLYYGLHRAHHRVRWLWATHSVHHSTTRFNLSAAYRLGWTDLLSGTWLFLLPLVWLGAPPLAVTAAFALNLLYQLFLHTETVGRLGWLEWVFNTPSHHRVHHACEPELLDRNFGGVLIVWDRLFGTFAAAEDGRALRYGLGRPEPEHHPLRIALGEWRRLFADLRRAGNLRNALRTALSPPA